MFKNFNEKGKNVTLKDGFQRYLNRCEINQLSEYTIKNKKIAFDQFIQSLQNSDVTYCHQLNSDLIDNYKKYLNNRKNIASTINEKISTLMSIINYFYEHGWCDKINASYVQNEEKLYETYTAEQLRKLLDKPNMKNCSFAHYRTWVMENFIYSTGVRKRTLINIKIEDLDFDNNLIILKVLKNKKQMYIPMSLKLKEILQEYLFYREGNPEDYLFPDKYGNQFTTDGIRGAITRYNQRKGVDVEGIHRFRHKFATDYVKNGGNIVDLQHLLGHASLEETQIYVNLLITDLKEHNNTFNPLDNFLNKQRKKTTIKMKIGE